ncbi:hypothetical protein ABZP36_026121 [Zizania latifolia]
MGAPTDYPLSTSARVGTAEARLEARRPPEPQDNWRQPVSHPPPLFFARSPTLSLYTTIPRSPSLASAAARQGSHSSNTSAAAGSHRGSLRRPV